MHSSGLVGQLLVLEFLDTRVCTPQLSIQPEISVGSTSDHFFIFFLLLYNTRGDCACNFWNKLFKLGNRATRNPSDITYNRRLLST